MNKLPVRLRLTLAFATALALFLAAAGALLYQHLADSLDHAIAQGLRARAADVAALVAQADNGLQQAPATPFASPEIGFAQVIDAHGRVLDSTPGLGRAPLLTAAQHAPIRSRPVTIQRTYHSGQPVRLLAVPVRAQGQRLLVIVGTSLESHDSTLGTLRSELIIGGPIALLVVSLIGYLLAAAALRPVERMRARADSLSATDLAEQLPVPAARDELSRLGTTLNDLLARVRTAIEHERSFVAEASHELRTPLTLLRAEIEHALARPRDRPELEAALRSAAGEVDRLSQLADDLLLLARLDRGALAIRAAPEAVADILNSVAARFEQRAQRAGQRILVDADNLVLELDRPRIEQALSNLVDNALRYADDYIHLYVVTTGGSVELHVTDGGPGLPAAFLPRALERFSRPDQARTGAGAGLGLAIVTEIARAHGGTARIANHEGGGADAWLSLPITAAPPTTRRAQPPHPLTSADAQVEKRARDSRV